MKICQYFHPQLGNLEPRLGILWEDKIIDPNLCSLLDYQREGYFNCLERANYKMPTRLSEILQLSDQPIEVLEEGLGLYLFFEKIGLLTTQNGLDLYVEYSSSLLDKPIDKINTYRDFYAHEKHVQTGFKKRGEPVPEAWFEMPVYYKGNTNSFYGTNDPIIWPSYSEKIDYELELGCILARDGKNIKLEHANDYIFGFTILNDVSARDIQKKEMSVRLGPSKGKDFCSIIGPVIVTYDEFDFKEPDLNMKAYVNDKLWSDGQSGDSHFTFNEMIHFASQEEFVRSTDLLGSGTVGTGCGLELDKWIQSGDKVRLEIESIGSIENTVTKKVTQYG